MIEDKKKLCAPYPHKLCNSLLQESLAQPLLVCKIHDVTIWIAKISNYSSIWINVYYPNTHQTECLDDDISTARAKIPANIVKLLQSHQ
jgi:hypothetical protein